MPLFVSSGTYLFTTVISRRIDGGMKSEDIRDQHSRLIGVIQTAHNGNKTVRDASYRLKGFYDAATNVTRDAGSQLVGRGDQSLGLLWR